MPAPEVTNAFLELLEKSQLLSPEQIAEAVETLGLLEQDAAGDVAEALVVDGRLTRFQADRLLEGRHRGFFIDRYKSNHILGTGGMGWLYLAEDVESGNEVAVKMLPKRHESDPGMVARFQIEAKVGMLLNHPNVVRTFEIAETDGVYGTVFYVVMELVRGINLEELIVSQGPLAWPQACDVIRQAATGLQHAHDRGTIHRDIKPANLLVEESGQVKIADFGLSKLETEAETEFSLQMIFGHDCLGTADYIAPEQTLDSNAVDGRADLYSLGCTMYATLTGKLPFPLKTTAEKLEAQRTRRPKPVSSRVEGLPEEVTAILEKMMSKQPKHRFHSARDVCQALSPLARRCKVDFSFSSVLAKRAEIARKKIAAKRSRRAGGSSAVAGQSDAVQSTIETTIRDDTRSA